MRRFAPVRTISGRDVEELSAQLARARFASSRQNFLTGTKSRIRIPGAGVTPAAGAGRAAPHLICAFAVDSLRGAGLRVRAGSA
jgi:hypothetical protein